MGLSGDFNQDGRIDKEDVNLLRMILRENDQYHVLLNQLTPEQREMLDINHDGNVGHEDLVALCQTLLQQEDPHAQALNDKWTALRDKVRSPKS